MSASASASARPAKVLSCASCRHRKVKCDKTQPICTQCQRNDFVCDYPSRKPTRRAPRPRQSELMDRISRLEGIVGQVDPERLAQLNHHDLQGKDQGQSAEDEQRVESRDSRGGSVSTSGRALTMPALTMDSQMHDGITQTDLKYLSSEFWGNLCAEVKGIREALDQPSDDDDDDGDEASPESYEASSSASIVGGSSGSLLGNSDYCEPREPLSHPPPAMIMRLWAVYVRNVDPMMKFLHRPSIEKLLQAQCDTAPATHRFASSTKSVLFAIYFCAVACLNAEDCQRELGESRDTLAALYRLRVERALAEADYLNSNELETLQALALYTTMIRHYAHNRTSWALTAVVIRLAQAQGLHLDGDGRRFTPFVAELRRRLWHFIVALDIRGSEDRGTDAILSFNEHSTIAPTPIDDEDFGPDSTGPLLPKEGPAENVILMVVAACSNVFGSLSHPERDETGRNRYVYTEAELLERIRCLENAFIHTAIPSHPCSMYAAAVGRLAILKVWLNIQYPYTGGPPPNRPPVSGHTMLRTSVSIMELRDRLISGELGDRFLWWTDLYVQWHPLAVALAELCVQTEGELVERAWEIVERYFPQSRETVADSASGSLWRPIRKLLRKARAARAEAAMRSLKISEPAATASVPASDSASALPTKTSAGFVASSPSLRAATTAAMPDATASVGQQPYETSASILFEYPPELFNFDMGTAMEQQAPLDWSLWNEFLQDTQMGNSPDGVDSI